MRESTKQFLNLLYDPQESVCVSPNKFAYHSVPQEELSGEITLVSPADSVKDFKIKEEDINLVAINPIKGYRNDSNVSAFRSFLIELDDGSLENQRKYVKNMEMPYSVCVFSGNKSLHYGIVLSKPCADIHIWRVVNQWILNIMREADQQIKNPSRSIRFPNNRRNDGKKKIQSLVEIKDRIDQTDLWIWLNKYPNMKPVEPKKVEKIVEDANWHNLPFWVRDTVTNGIDVDRNTTWFSVACKFAELGYAEDRAIDELDSYFTEDVDFNRREWLLCIKSAFKKIQGV